MLSITSNVAFGYKLYMNAASGSSNSLTNPATSPAATIPTLSTAYASGSFPTNYWGYTGGLDKSGETGGLNCSANYCPILAYESDPEDYSPNRLIDSGDGPVASKTTTLTFASKIDTTKPSGTYSTSILFTAVGNPTPPGPATLDTGQTVNAKLKSLAAGTTITPEFDPDSSYDWDYAYDESVKSIDVHLETTAPVGFVPSEANTISSSASRKPIYVIFDNTNDAGVMHFYTEGEQIALSADASLCFTYSPNLLRFPIFLIGILPAQLI